MIKFISVKKLCLQRENMTLRQRLDRCESEENEKLNQEEEHRRRERLYQEELRKKEKTLHKVNEFTL